MTVAVTGATGNLGALVVSHLLRRGTPAEQIVALVRDPAKAASLSAQGVVVRAFDYDQPTALADALIDVDSLLLVSGNAMGRRAAQHQAVIDAAAKAGVDRLVYTSAPAPAASINPVAPEHAATEAALAASGVAHVVLRNGWYNENYLGELSQVGATGAVLTSAGTGRVASAARSDYADAAAVVLAGTARTGVYELSGDVAWSFADLAADLSTVLGRTIGVSAVTGEQQAQILAGAGLDEETVGFVVGVDAAIAAGELGVVNGQLSGLIGRATTPLLDTLRAGATA